MSVINIWCVRCRAVRAHAADDAMTSCTGCGLVRHDLGEELAILVLTAAEMPVVGIEYCVWCNAWLPVGHDCPASAVGCTTNPPEGPTSGACPACCRAQAQGLAALDADFKQDPYGSPSDIDAP